MLRKGLRSHARCVGMYLTRQQIIAQAPVRAFLYLDELERETMCKARACRGAVRIAMVRKGETSGFVGGGISA